MIAFPEFSFLAVLARAMMITTHRHVQAQTDTLWVQLEETFRETPFTFRHVQKRQWERIWPQKRELLPEPEWKKEKKLISFAFWSCLSNIPVPNPDYTATANFRPGKYLDATEQCKLKFGPDALFGPVGSKVLVSSHSPFKFSKCLKISGQLIFAKSSGVLLLRTQPTTIGSAERSKELLVILEKYFSKWFQMYNAKIVH